MVRRTKKAEGGGGWGAVFALVLRPIISRPVRYSFPCWRGFLRAWSTAGLNSGPALNTAWGMLS